jgi:hypothetical protein
MLIAAALVVAGVAVAVPASSAAEKGGGRRLRRRFSHHPVRIRLHGELGVQRASAQRWQRASTIVFGSTTCDQAYLPGFLPTLHPFQAGNVQVRDA